MLRLQTVLVSLGALLVLMVPSAAVSADTVSVSQKIVVRAVVLPAREIVVSPQDESKIVAIYSNTSTSVTPTVHIGSVTGPEVPLTPDLQQQYDSLLAAYSHLSAGIIQPTAAETARLSQARTANNFLSLISKTVTLNRY